MCLECAGRQPTASQAMLTCAFASWMLLTALCQEPSSLWRVLHSILSHTTGVLPLRCYLAGDGLASSQAVLNQYRGISDAGLFFEQVLNKPYVNQVRMS